MQNVMTRLARTARWTRVAKAWAWVGLAHGLSALAATAPLPLPTPGVTPAASPALRAPAAKPATGLRAAATERGYAIEPVPDWVKPVTMDEIQALQAAKAPLQVLMVDRQTRLGAGAAAVDDHAHMVRRIQETAGLEVGAQWEIEFDPSYQKLALNALVVWRGEQRLDRLAHAQVKLLQRESQLERQIYDGRTTASIVMDDVRVGDRLELAYTLHGANPVFGSKWVERDWSLSSRGPLARYQWRLLAPAERQLQVQAEAPRHQVLRREFKPGWQEIVIRRDNAPMWVWDPQLPYADTLGDQVWVSEFADWAEVSRWAAALFENSGQNAQAAPELRHLAAQLRKPDPAQSLQAALDFVQTEVRYFGTEFGVNSHRPAEPERVLKQRFGDCKDKAGLLVALLKAMDIAATPLLVATDWRGAVQKLPASPLAFNHAIVLATVGADTWVLDGTRSFQTGPLAERQARGLGLGLLAKDGATLQALPSAEQELRMEVAQRLHFARVADDPTLDVTITYHGAFAEGVRGALADDRRQDFQKQLNGDLSRVYSRLNPVGDMSYAPVAGHNAVQVQLRFELPSYLRLQEEKILVGDIGLPLLMPVLRLSDQTPRTRPLQLSSEGLYRESLRVEFAQDVFSRVQTGSPQELGDAYTRLNWHLNQDKAWVEMGAELRVAATPLPPAQWGAHRDALVKLWPRLSTTLTVPTVELARREGLNQALQQLEDDVKQGRVAARTVEQYRARNRLKWIDAQLAGQQLTKDARRQLLVLQAVQWDHLGVYGRALDSLYQAQVITPKDPDLLSAWAVNAMLRRQDAEAEQRAGEALALNAEDQGVRMTQGQARYLQRRPQEARDDFLALARQMPESDRGYAALWLYLSAQQANGGGALALSAMASGMPLDAAAGSLPAPNWPQAWPYPVVQALLNPQAEGTAQRALERNPDGSQPPASELAGRRCELAFYLGEANRLAGNLTQARSYYQQSLDTQVVEFVEYALAQRRLDALQKAP